MAIKSLKPVGRMALMAASTVMLVPVYAPAAEAPAKLDYVVTAAQIAQAAKDLAAKADKSGGVLTQAPLITVAPFTVALDYRKAPSRDVHADLTGGEFMIVLGGTGAITLGGTLIDPKRQGDDLHAQRRTGGQAYELDPGAEILVPEGMAHAITRVDGALTMITVHLPHPSAPAATISGAARAFISGADLAQTADDAAAKNSATTVLTPLLTEGPFNNHMEYRIGGSSNVHAHPTEAEMLVVLQGSGDFKLDGKMVDPTFSDGALHAEKTIGSQVFHASQGDIVLVPPGVPHTVLPVTGRFVLISTHFPKPAATADK
ncbi:MAG TPA: AraC family ligand binding domain-containing protein [Caulobacteraceae bacterium]|nr:AraC family ligand binding domain-containing protein [Caulobacteraceae bacterium]